MFLLASLARTGWQLRKAEAESHDLAARGRAAKEKGTSTVSRGDKFSR
jgi:hypothetical protein